LKQKEANNTLIAFHCCAFSTIENAWGSFFFRNKLYHALEVGTYMALANFGELKHPCRTGLGGNLFFQ
jgi:hypothetical protein